MPSEREVSRLTWTLADQAAVSLAAFLVNIALARGLSAGEYGIFALLLAGMLGLQVLTSSLLFYPLSVRLAAASREKHQALLNTSVLLAGVMSLALSVFLFLLLIALGYGGIALFAAGWFFLWQMQEAMRRCLFADFRHRAAMLGDSIGWFGQVLVVGVLHATGSVSLPRVIACIALPLAAGAAIQAWQLRLSFRGVGNIPAVVRDFWYVGRFSLLSNLVSVARLQAVPWALAVSAGPAAVAGFQAILNIGNLANPIILGLCNIIPQTAARAHDRGSDQAWHAARVYAYLGAIPTLGFYIVALAAPRPILDFLYGSQSAYLGLELQVQLLITAYIFGYAAEMVCSYLHGIDAARRALVINAWGLAAIVLLNFPLTNAFGLTGACLALLCAGITRFVCSHIVLGRVIQHAQHRLA